MDTIEDADLIDRGGGLFDADIEWKKYIELDPNDEHLSELHFKNFFFCAKGNANFFDEHHSSRLLPHYSLVKKRKYHHMIHSRKIVMI